MLRGSWNATLWSYQNHKYFIDPRGEIAYQTDAPIQKS